MGKLTEATFTSKMDALISLILNTKIENNVNEIAVNNKVDKSGDDMTGNLQILGIEGVTSISLKTDGSISAIGSIQGNKVYGAVWNDYAEYREGLKDFQPGQVVVENGDDTLSLSTQKFQKGAMIVSDTFGFAIGKTKKCNIPVAVSGRVLVYTEEPQEFYKNHIGDCVCAAPNGKVALMTDEEAAQKPAAIIGTVSSVPSYQFWGPNEIKVDNRVWIKVK